VGKFFENWLEGSEKNFPRGGKFSIFLEDSAPLEILLTNHVIMIISIVYKKYKKACDYNT
jgi:hypothetical protein